MIRTCKDTDLIADLDRACFPTDTPMDRELIESCHWGVAWVGDEPVGFCGYRPGDTAGSAYLERYGVLPDHSARGTGTALLKWCARNARRHCFTSIVTYVFYHNVQSVRALVKTGYFPTHWNTDILWVEKRL